MGRDSKDWRNVSWDMRLQSGRGCMQTVGGGADESKPSEQNTVIAVSQGSVVTDDKGAGLAPGPDQVCLRESVSGAQAGGESGATFDGMRSAGPVV